MIDPTQSPGPYMQMFGRAVRPAMALKRLDRRANRPQSLAFFDRLAVTMRHRLRDQLDETKPFGSPAFRGPSAAQLAYHERKHAALDLYYFRQRHGHMWRQALEESDV